MGPVIPVEPSSGGEIGLMVCLQLKWPSLLLCWSESRAAWLASEDEQASCMNRQKFKKHAVNLL